jgi:hypothetical protein
MFERFTDGAKRVVALAQEEARVLNHNYIGTEHLLLGLIHEGDGIAARALESLGVTLQSARQQAEEIVGRGKHKPSGHVPFTPRAKKVLELSLREALHLGDNYIGTEHILLGVLREGDGVAVQMLVRLHVDLRQVRQAVIRLADSPQGSSHRAVRFARRPEAASPRAAELAEGIGLPADPGVPRQLWLTSMQNQLTMITERLDAIERHLGMRAAAKPSGAEAEAPGGTSSEPEAAGGAEREASSGTGTKRRPTGGTGTKQKATGGTGTEQKATGGTEPEATSATGTEPEATSATGAEPEAASATGAEPEAASAPGAEPEATSATGAEPEATSATGAEPEAASGTGPESSGGAEAEAARKRRRRGSGDGAVAETAGE